MRRSTVTVPDHTAFAGAATAALLTTPDAGPSSSSAWPASSVKRTRTLSVAYTSATTGA